MADDTRPRPLDGIRVLDLTRFLSGPICGRVLADLGADVIKVEPPEGDNTRRVQPAENGRSIYFAQINTGKRNISIDLGHPDGAELLLQLAEKADVLLENLRPGVADRLGIGAATVMARNPRLIYCSITGYGQTGPWARRGAFAPLVQAESGTIEFAARKRHTDPLPEAQSHGDVYPGMLATQAILAALVQRGTTGVGQHLDVSMAEALLYTNEWTAVELVGYDRPQLFGGWNALITTTADGSSVAFPGNPAVNFTTWAKAMGRTDYLEDARYRTSADRLARADEVVAIIRAYVATFPDPETLEAHLDAFRMPMGVLRSMQEITSTPWAEDRGVVTTTDDGIRIPAAPFRSSASAIGARGGVRSRGADNVTVLRELLGLDPSAVDRLVGDGVLSAD